MGTEDKKDTRPKRTKEENAKYWEEKKKQRNYRGIECNTTESYVSLDLAKYADMGLKNLRAGVFIRYPVGVAQPLIEAYNDAILLQEAIIVQISQVIDRGDYKTPKSIVELKETHKVSEPIQKIIDKIKEIGIKEDKKEDTKPEDIKPETVKK